MTNAVRISCFSQTDKVSVLGSTIEYVHHLRERVKVLQDIQSMGSTQPPISDARSRAGSGDDGNNNEVEIKVEANLQGTTVLLRVVCPEKKGVLIKLLTELEKLGLSTMNTNVVPFADSSLNITITAQVLHNLLPLYFTPSVLKYKGFWTCWIFPSTMNLDGESVQIYSTSKYPIRPKSP